ncbi:MAG: hypothetical protein AAGJ35_04960 [Myxococcota bacterium]
MRPSYHLQTTPHGTTIAVELPGVQKQDIDIDVEAQVLSVSAKRYRHGTDDTSAHQPPQEATPATHHTDAHTNDAPGQEPATTITDEQDEAAAQESNTPHEAQHDTQQAQSVDHSPAPTRQPLHGLPPATAAGHRRRPRRCGVPVVQRRRSGAGHPAPPLTPAAQAANQLIAPPLLRHPLSVGVGRTHS